MQTKLFGGNMSDVFSLQKEGYLKTCRKVARELLRNKETVTIEDITKLVPRPAYLHRNTLGSVFNNEFVPVDFVKAKHSEAKGRYIRTWRLK